MSRMPKLDRPEVTQKVYLPSSPSELSWKARLALVLLGVVLAGVMLEIGLRVVYAVQAQKAREAANAAQTPAGEFWAIYDPILGYRLNPKFGDHNPDGLRDHPIGPKDGRFRILFLGDSIAYYGDTIDDTFVAHMRTELQRETALRQLDVIDAGIKGYSDYQELQYLKKYGLNFQPDLVVVEFCLNDLHKFEHVFQLENGQIVAGTYQFSEEALTSADQRSWLRRLWDKSRLLTTLESTMRVAAAALSWKADDGFWFDHAVDISTAWQDKPWNDISSQLQEMADLSHQYHFNLLVVVFPVGVQYDANYLARDRAYVLKPQSKLKDITARLGISYYDLYPDLNASLFEDGTHLTKEGRQFVGQRLASVLAHSQLNASGNTQKPSTK